MSTDSPRQKYSKIQDGLDEVKYGPHCIDQSQDMEYSIKTKPIKAEIQDGCRIEGQTKVKRNCSIGLDLHGWLRLLTYWVICFTRAVGYSAMGVFIVEFTEYFEGATQEKIAWIAACHMGVVPLIFSMPIGWLTERFGAQSMVALSALIGSGGLILSSILPSLVTLYIGYGVMLGYCVIAYQIIASLLIQTTLQVRRNLLAGLSFTILSVGAFVWPALSRVLIDRFCWQGALLVLAALNLNVVALSQLLPSTSTTKHYSSRLQKDGTANSDGVGYSAIESQVHLEVNIYNESDKTSTNGHLPCKEFHTNDETKHTKLKLIDHNDLEQIKRTVEHKHTHVSCCKNTEDIQVHCSVPASKVHMPFIVQQTEDTEMESKCLNREGPEIKQLDSELNPVPKPEDEHIERLPDPSKNGCPCRIPSYKLLLVYCTGFFFCQITLYSVFMYLPTRCKDEGYTKNEAVFLVALVSIASCVFRTPAGALGDFKWINPCYVTAAAQVVTGVTCIVSVYCKEVGALAACSCIMGSAMAFFVGAVNACTEFLVGRHQLAMGFSMVNTAQGLSMIVGLPLSGYFLDNIGSSQTLFLYTGGAGIAGGLFILLAGIIRRTP